MIKKTIVSLVFLLSTFLLKAQEVSVTEPQMADRFRDDGKIYVVISVISIIFVCIVLFLVYLERRLRKLEQEITKD